MSEASSGRYSFNTHYYVCSLIQPASLFTHIFIILVFRVLFDSMSVFSPSLDPRFFVSKLYPSGLLAVTIYHLSRTNQLVSEIMKAADLEP